MNLHETCACGAGVSLEGIEVLADGMASLSIWRDEHRHTAPAPAGGTRVKALGFVQPVIDEEED